MVSFLTALAMAVGGLAAAAPAAQASGLCYVLYEPTVTAKGGVVLPEVMPGQTVVVHAWARWYTVGDCSGADNSITWTLKLFVSTCGYLPTLAQGTDHVTQPAYPGQELTAKTLTIPTVCPPGSQYAVGQPVTAGGSFAELSGATAQGGGLKPYNFKVIDGRPDTACPPGRTTGDAGCGNPGGDPVNSLTGAFMYADRDFSMPVRGGVLDVARSYDSQLTRTSAMGTGWTYGYTDSLVVTSNKVTWRTSAGASIEFPLSYGTNWQAPFGNSARLTQNSDGTFTVKTEDLWSLSFTSAGGFTRATDRNGQVTTITRDGDGRVGTVSQSGRSLTYGYDGAGALTSVTATGTDSSADPAVTQYDYSGGQLVAVTKSDGSHTVYDYDSAGRLSSIRNTASAAPQMQVAYGTDGRITSQTDGNGKVTTWSWDAATKTSTMTDPRGGAWKDVYANSWLIKQIDPTGVETDYDWDEAGKLYRVRAPGGQEDSFVYDGSGRLTAKIDVDGNAESMTYSGTNLEPASKTDPAGRTTSFTYDANRNLKVLTPPITSAKTTNNYASGTFDLASVIDPTQQTTTFTHDGTTGDLTGATSPLGNKTTTSTDGFGRVASVTPPAGNVSGASGDWSTNYQHDAMGRITKVTDPQGVKVTTTYDDFGRVKTAKDADGNVTTNSYDNAGHLTQAKLADDSTQEYTYDPNGNVATATDPRGHVKSFSYDAANRVTAVEAEGRTWHYTYDSAGRRSTTQAPSGRTVTIGYDTHSRPTSIDYSDSTPDVAIVYDSLGRKQSVAAGDETWAYTYDDLDRPLTISHGSDEWVYTWDAAGRLASRKAPGQSATSYVYDNDGRLTKAKRSGTDLATYAYDTGANTVTRTLANGMTTVESFDRGGNLASSVEKNSGGTVTHSLTYTRDLQGNPVKVVDADGASTVQVFDSRNRLTKVCRNTTTCDGATDFVAYAYDANDNITTETRPGSTLTRTYDDHDQLTSESDGTTTTSFGYDDDGNRTSAGDTTYTVNAAGQVTSSTTGGDTTEFTYDPAGLLASKTVGGTTTKLDYDPLSAQLVGERSGGDVTHQFVYGREAVAMTTSSGTDYLTTNDVGSVVATRDSSGGLQKSYEYEPYGAVKHETGSGAASPLQYAGGLSLSADALRFGVRQYDATTATFTTSDPAATGETYGYASGNPAVYTDPLGLFSIGDALDSLSSAVSRADDALLSNPVVRLAVLVGTPYGHGILISRALKNVDPMLALDVAIAALTIVNIIQLGLDPATDGAEAAVIGARLGGEVAVRDGWLSALRLGARNERGAVDMGSRFTDDQQALVQLAKEAKRRGGISLDDAETMGGWADELGLPGHGPAVHPGRPGFGGTTVHINVGPIKHIAVN